MRHRWEPRVFRSVRHLTVKDEKTGRRTTQRNSTEDEVGVEYTHVGRPRPSIRVLRRTHPDN
jgi:hypothetical protein